jgi:Kef-type K+ transport system membrane component KefB
MTLLTAHKVMILTGIAFCALFAVRAAIISVKDGGAVPILFLVVSTAGAIGLAAYLRWLVRTKGRRLEAAANRRSSARDN